MRSLFLAALAIAALARPAVAGDVTKLALGTGRSYAFKSIAVDPGERRVFLGSWREKAIVALDLDTGAPRVIETPYNGKLTGMGVALRGDLLYAVMNEIDNRPEATPISVLLVIAVTPPRPTARPDTPGRLLHAYELRASTGAKRHHFNHVVVDARGTAYVSDTIEGRIYRVDTTRPDARLELVLAHADLSWVHGIALVANESILATTSYKGGIRFLDLATRTWKPYRDLATKGDDGLIHHAGALYGVGQDTITRYVLGPRADTILRREVVLQNHALFDDPRDLQVVNGWLYCLADIDPTTKGETHLVKLRL